MINHLELKTLPPKPVRQSLQKNLKNNKNVSILRQTKCLNALSNPLNWKKLDLTQTLCCPNVLPDD